MMRGWWRPPVWAWPLLLAPVLVPAYYTAERLAGTTTLVTQSLYSLSSVVAIAGLLVGAARHERAGRGAWLALAAGQTAMLTGDIVYFLISRGGRAVAYPGPPDVCYLLGYLGLAGGLVWLVRRRTPGWDLPSLIDAAVVAVGAGLVGWVYLIEPLSAGSGGTAQAVTVAYPVMDLALLAFGVRLMLGSGARPASFWLLSAWLGAVLVGDTIYSLEALRGTYDGTFTDGLWICGVLSLGAAALHPSARRLDDPSSVTAPDATTGRLVVLAVTSILAPVVLAVQYARGAALHVPEVVVACVVLFLLVLARMAGLVRTQRAMAVTDGLTGLATRRHLQAALAGAERGGAPFALLLIDVDHFKSVNDTYGHQAGDRVLAEFGCRMRAMARSGDVVARYGGEEFAVLLPGVGPGTIEEVARRFHLGLAGAPVAIDGDQLLPVTVSVGGGCMSGDIENAEELTRVADQALYAAKEAGRNRVVVPDHRAVVAGHGVPRSSV
jgi:two-component system, cell cycle response regulator